MNIKHLWLSIRNYKYFGLEMRNARKTIQELLQESRHKNCLFKIAQSESDELSGILRDIENILENTAFDSDKKVYEIKKHYPIYGLQKDAPVQR